MSNRGAAGKKYYGLEFIDEAAVDPTSISVGDGVKVVNTLSAQLNDTENLIIAKMYRSVFLDSLSGANWFPHGANITAENFEYMENAGGFYLLDGSTLSPLVSYKDQSQFFCENNDGVSHDFLIYGHFRWLFDKGAAGTAS